MDTMSAPEGAFIRWANRGGRDVVWASGPLVSSVPDDEVSDRIRSVVCIGAGFVGGPTMAVLSKYCSDVRVTVVDINKRRIDAWNSDKLPFLEPELAEFVFSRRGKNLFFTTEVAESIKTADIIFIAVNTPPKEFGTKVGYDLSAYESATISIAKHAEQPNVIVVEKSTVPVRTAERVRALLEANKQHGGVNFEVISNPEFLAEGTAIRDSEFPDRILIGGHDTRSGIAAVAALKRLYETWVPEERIITSNLWSAELAKLASNAFLAQRVSSINAMSALCEVSGADVREVSKVLGSDHRIGAKFLNASIGFGGSCFGKDLLGLIYICESYGLKEAAEYWRQVIKMNDFQKRRFCEIVLDKMFGSVKGKNIAILGFAFKKDTSDFRESASIDVAKFLLEEGANVFVYDPAVNGVEVAMQVSPHIRCEPDAFSATLEAHAVLVLTEWDEFRDLDWEQIYDHMNKPAFVFDGRNLVDEKALSAIGFDVFSIGRPYKSL